MIGDTTLMVSAGCGAIAATGASPCTSICWPYAQWESQTLAFAVAPFDGQSDGIVSSAGWTSFAAWNAGTASMQACATVTTWAKTTPSITSAATHRRCRRSIRFPEARLCAEDASVFDRRQQPVAL